MGNTFGDMIPHDADARDCAISRFYSSTTWIEGAATRQIEEVAALPDMLSLAAFPDLHPGKYGPVGMAALSSRLHPQLIGNDIGCGMSLFALDLPVRKLRIDKAAEQLRKLEEVDLPNPEQRLEELDLNPDLFASSLGTIGGGNHFCELQAIDTVADDNEMVDRQKLYLLVHSGSRALGTETFQDVITGNGAMAKGLELGTQAAVDYLLDHDAAVRWASLNRRMIAERAADCLRADLELVTDIPHNLVRITDAGVIHYKGAAAVTPGVLAPIAGSRATLSHLVEALPGIESSLGGISHGAGRKYDRRSMHGRVGANRSERDALLANDWGGVAICDDRNLVIEEAASAYKDAGKVVADLEQFGLVRPVATLRPLVTYKSVMEDARIRDRDKRRDRTTIRRLNHG